jgi:hypothetical protein
MQTQNAILAAMITPAMFYTGLVCAGIPILIHLLSKRRFRRVRWAATDFLLEANRQNRRRMRLEELILLALRCLAMLLIGMVLARIFVRPQALAAILGAPTGTRHIVLLDDSFSMGLADPSDQSDPRDATVFARGLTTIERLVTWLKQESPNDRLVILPTSRPDQPILAETSLASLDLTAFQDRWRSRKPSNLPADMPRSFATIRQLLDVGNSTLNAMIYVISDFQRKDWVLGTGGPESSGAVTGHANTDSTQPRVSPLAPLVGWDRAGRSLKIVMVDAGAARNGNLCVTAIEPQRSQPVAGLGTRLVVRVANFAAVESKASSLQVYLGDAGQPPVPVPAISPNQTVEVPIEVTFPQAEPAALTVELQPDALPIDNTRSCVVPVAKALRVLIINGEPSPDPYEDEAYLLSTALHPQGPQFSGNEVTLIEENELDQTDLSTFHLVILANVSRVEETTVARLESYASLGGGLAVFAGDQIDTEAYNRSLFRDGAGLLPARLGELASVPGDDPGQRIGQVNINHPALRPFRGLLPTCFEGVTVWGYFTCAPAGAASQPEGVVGKAPEPISGPRPNGGPERSPAAVLIRLDDPDHNPLIVQRDFGRGHVWLITTTADKEWTNLPDHPIFVVLMMEMAQYLARQPERAEQQLVGQPIDLTLEPGRYQPNASVRTPSYPEEPPFPVSAETDAKTGRLSIRWPKTEQPGIYHFELTDQAGGRAIERAAIDVDTTESDLRRADPAELLLASAPFVPQYVTASRFAGGFETAARRELWPLLLIVLLAVLMTEQSLAWWFGSDRRLASLLGGRRS